MDPDIEFLHLGEWLTVDAVSEVRRCIGRTPEGFHWKVDYSYQGGDIGGDGDCDVWCWSEPVPTRAEAEQKCNDALHSHFLPLTEAST